MDSDARGRCLPAVNPGVAGVMNPVRAVASASCAGRQDSLQTQHEVVCPGK